MHHCKVKVDYIRLFNAKIQKL